MHIPKHMVEGLVSYSVPIKELKVTHCFTTLKAKRTIHENLCDHSLEALKTDLTDHLYENGADVPPSTENKASGNWIALVMPDAVPSRLALMTRIASLMMLCDDADKALAPTYATNDVLNARFAGGLEEALPVLYVQPQASKSQPCKPRQSTRSTIVQCLLRPIVLDLLSTDRAKGFQVLKAWRNHHRDLPAAPPVAENTANLDDYLRTCVPAFPTKPWMALLQFALGQHLHEKEAEAVQPVVEQAMQSATLTRDYWAWPKESRGVDSNKRVRNAVAVSMEENECPETEAMVVVREAAVAAEERFLQRKLDLIQVFGEERGEVVLFLDAVEQFVAGNSLWCSSCPRFHRK